MSHNYVNKIIFKVKRDKMNGYFHFGKGKYRIQLSGDSRKDWFWIFQYATKVLGEEGANKFKEDLKNIFVEMEKDNAEIFTLYEGEERVAPKEVA